MFKITLLLCVVLAIHAQPAPQHISYREPDYAPRPYDFAYETELDGGRMARKESGDASGRVVGSYSFSEDDGRSRVVEYVADGDGFRANVKTNEPGTKNESPADVVFYSSAAENPHLHSTRPGTRHSHIQPIAHAASPYRYYVRHPDVGRWH